MYQLLAVSAFRKDRFVAAANRFVQGVMGARFYSETEMDLAAIVEEVSNEHGVTRCAPIGQKLSQN